MTYFHPELEIKDQKYILNVSNILWSKELDIENAITAWKEANPEFKVENEKTSFCLDELYGYYCKFYRTPNSGVKNNLVSKSYFQKYVNHRME